MTETNSIPLTADVAAELAEINREIQRLQQIGNAIIFGFRSAKGIPKDWIFDGARFLPPKADSSKEE